MNFLIGFFYVLVLGIAITSGGFVKFSIMGIPMIIYCMAALAIVYILYLIKHRTVLYLWKSERILSIFVLYGLFIVLLSFMGTYGDLIQSRLLMMRSYIPRQAYYLLIFPAVLVLSQEEFYGRMQKVLQQYRLEFFWGIYFFHLLLVRQFSLSVETAFFLAYLSLQGKSKHKYEYVMFAAVLFTPIATGGETTNLIIRLLYFVYYIVRGKKIIVTQLVAFGMSVAVAAMFIVPFFSSQFSNKLDANSYWRLRYWHDELLQLVDSHFLGVGYGTAYATTSFTGNTLNIAGGPFGATEEYSTMDQLFVTGSHNSLISVSFRLGVIGITLLLSMLRMLYKGMRQQIAVIPNSAFFAFFSCIVVISVNVGLESPAYLILFIFSLICCDAEVKRAFQMLHEYTGEAYVRQMNV